MVFTPCWPAWTGGLPRRRCNAIGKLKSEMPGVKQLWRLGMVVVERCSRRVGVVTESPDIAIAIAPLAPLVMKVMVWTTKMVIAGVIPPTRSIAIAVVAGTTSPRDVLQICRRTSRLGSSTVLVLKNGRTQFMKHMSHIQLFQPIAVVLLPHPLVLLGVPTIYPIRYHWDDDSDDTDEEQANQVQVDDGWELRISQSGSVGNRPDNPARSLRY
ncbi:hypothetical protein DFH09DRAFT_1096179 [Mycena vulgaris]|nr:hypothetical protein DFH09DRAFT_1096179 [Mycena vulgaris]